MLIKLLAVILTLASFQVNATASNEEDMHKREWMCQEVPHKE